MTLSFDSGDGCILSVDSHRVVPAPFLTKTYQLVDDPVTNEIVSWGEDGSTFVVWRPPEFARDLLPNYFKHNNFSSFVRQLNTYGFRKVVPDRWEFANDFFRKGERHLLCEIHRRKAQQTLSHLQHYSSPSLSPSTSCEDPQLACTPGTWSPLSSSPLHSPRGLCAAAAAAAANVSSAPVSLSDENERLRRDNCLLLSELARLQKLYDDALLFLQQNMRLCSDDARLSYKQQQQQQFPLQRHHHLQQQQQRESSLDHQRLQFGGNKTVGMTDGVAAKASTIDFVDGKLKELNAVHCSGSTKSAAGLANRNGNVLPAVEENEQADVKPGPKLFGVVLHGRKRLHPDQQAASSSTDEDSTGPFPSSKSTKVELELMPPPDAAAPWLGFRASRDERVCI